MNHQLLAYLASGLEPQKLGSGAPSAAPYGVYAASDGELLIATASEPQFPRLCAALGLDHLAGDPKFARMADRITNRGQLDLLIAERIAGGTVAQWLGILGEAGISCGPVNSVAAACQMPEVAERALLRDSSAANGAAGIPQLRLPIDPDASGIRRRPPALGEHTAEILREIGIAPGA